MKLQNSSWSGNWKVKFWKFEDEWISFCLAFILTSYLIQMILVPSFQLTILPSKDSNKISSTLTSPRLRDNFFSLQSRNQPIRSLDFFIEKTEIESLSLSMQSNDGVLAQKRSEVRTREVRLAKVLVNRQTELLICIDQLRNSSLWLYW